MNIIRPLLFLFGSIGLAYSQAVPANRLPPAGYWNPGCIGANGQTYRQSGTFIPPVNLTNIINVQNPPYNAVGDGVHDDTASIQAAIAAGNNSVIYLPAGTYKITGQLELANPNYSWGWSSKILRGAGPANTFIKAYGSTGPFIDASGSASDPTRAAHLARVAPRGTNTIVLASWDSGGFFDAENWGIISEPNNLAGAPWTCGQAYEGNAKCQMIHILSRNSTTRTITFDSPAYFDWDTNATFTVFYGSDSSAGVENLSIENVGGANTHNIGFAGVFNSWVRNIESKNATGGHIHISSCARCDVLDSYIHGYYPASGVGGGNTDYGAWIFGQSSDNLVINNTFDRTRHALIVEYGDTGNVFAYNYCQNPINEGQEATDFLMENADQHGCTQWNLWEGNVVPKFSCDNSLGGSVYNMAFRNSFTRNGLPTTTVGQWGYDIQVSNYWVSVIGDINGIATDGYNPTLRVGAPNGSGDWASTNPATWSPGPNFPDPTGTPADPRPTLYVHGVYDMQSNVVTWASSNSNHALPASLFLTGPPSFWGSTPWPPIGPDVTGYTNVIPAQANLIGYLLAASANNSATNSTSTNPPTPPTQLQVTPL